MWMFSWTNRSPNRKSPPSTISDLRSDQITHTLHKCLVLSPPSLFGSSVLHANDNRQSNTTGSARGNKGSQFLARQVHDLTNFNQGLLWFRVPACHLCLVSSVLSHKMTTPTITFFNKAFNATRLERARLHYEAEVESRQHGRPDRCISQYHTLTAEQTERLEATTKVCQPICPSGMHVLMLARQIIRPEAHPFLKMEKYVDSIPRTFYPERHILYLEFVTFAYHLAECCADDNLLHKVLKCMGDARRNGKTVTNSPEDFARLRSLNPSDKVKSQHLATWDRIWRLVTRHPDQKTEKSVKQGLNWVNKVMTRGGSSTDKNRNAGGTMTAMVTAELFFSSVLHDAAKVEDSLVGYAIAFSQKNGACGGCGNIMLTCKICKCGQVKYGGKVRDP